MKNEFRFPGKEFRTIFSKETNKLKIKHLKLLIIRHFPRENDPDHPIMDSTVNHHIPICTEFFISVLLSTSQV